MVHRDYSTGNGPAYTVLKDTAAAARINNSLLSIEKGTAAFNEDMEALKHNFLTRGYFRKEAKKNKKLHKK
jgi:phospholipid/cholesterol/gamma-HCH transport system substrate-binding protein